MINSSKNKKTIPENPKMIPTDFKNVIFSFLVKKCARIDPLIGVVLINIAAKQLFILLVPIAIRVNGIAMLHNPIAAYGFQFFEKASIFMLLILHNKNKGILANKTLTKARVKGSQE